MCLFLLFSVIYRNFAPVNYQNNKMSNMGNKMLWLTVCLFWLAAGSANAQSVAPDKTGMGQDALDWTKEVVMGWNLGNSMECPNNETEWGNPKTTKAMIHAVRESGFNAIRIPVRWINHVTDQTTMAVDAAWLSRVQELVDWCLEEDMYVVINTHHEEWLEVDPTKAKQAENNRKLSALWTTIATYFRDYGERLIFAGTNEVRRNDWGSPNKEQQEVQNGFNQTFVDAVRATGGKNYYRNLIVQTFACSSWHGLSGFTIPEDKVENRLSVEVHYYDPYGYGLLTGNTANDYYYWGTAYKDKGRVPSDNEQTQANLFDRLRSTWASKGLGIVIGEYGVTNHYQEKDKETQQENMQYYLKTLVGNARARGFAAFYWDNNNFSNGNEAFGIFRRWQNMSVGTPYFLKGIAEGAGAEYKEPTATGGDNTDYGEGGVTFWEGDELLNWGDGLQLTVPSNMYAGQGNTLQTVLYYTQDYTDYDQIQIFYGDWSELVPFQVGTAEIADGKLIPSAIYGTGSGTQHITPVTFSESVFKTVEQKGIVIQGHGIRLTKVALAKPADTGISSVLPPSRPTDSQIYTLGGQRVTRPIPGRVYIKDARLYISR